MVSIERLNPRCGYTKDNVRLVCHEVSTPSYDDGDDEDDIMIMCVCVRVCDMMKGEYGSPMDERVSGCNL